LRNKTNLKRNDKHFFLEVAQPNGALYRGSPRHATLNENVLMPKGLATAAAAVEAAVATTTMTTTTLDTPAGFFGHWGDK